MLEFDKYPYSYDKIDIKPYNPSKINIEIHGIPIPQESMHINVYLFPKDVKLNDKNKIGYNAGSTSWHGVNRYKKCCKRCNKSRTNLKIDIEDYALDNNIQIQEIKEKYNWFIEGQGRLHSCDSTNYKTYNQDEIIKDGSISLVIIMNNIC